MSDSKRPTPKPGPPSAVRRWFQERPSEYPWEQQGLDHIREQMPKVEPYRAWATFSFTGNSGRINECDLFIAVPAGLFLIELKGHPGVAVNNGDTWSFRNPETSRILTLRNPLHLTDMKSKELKGRLSKAAQQDGSNRRFPRIEPAVFLSAPNLDSRLDDVQSTRVYGRDGLDTGLPAIWADLLGRPPQHESQRITPEFARKLPKYLEKIGIAVSTAHLTFGDDWRMRDEVLDEGPTWQDRLAKRSLPVKEEGRVRIYLTERQAAPDKQISVTRAAKREYEVLQGITHRGIARAVQIRDHQGGPAILFEHRESDLRLDDYLAAQGTDLDPEVRLGLVRQIADAVRYAHDRALYHRALAARSVYVSQGKKGSAPVLRVIDWQAAARDFDTSGHTSIGNDPLTGEHIEDTAQVYLAPEFAPHADPVSLDVFGIGALAYFILTGQEPAALRTELMDRLTREGGLHPSVVVDGIIDSLDALIFDATRADWGLRLDSVDEFLRRLDEVEKDLTAPLSEASIVDPLTAIPGQVIDDDWQVERVLGTGATARALLVSRTVEDDDGVESTAYKVLKVALDAAKDVRLEAEARALEKVGGGYVVQLLGPPRELGERMVLDLEYAGPRSLAMWLREEGKLSYDRLERFGNDLFNALDLMAGKGVWHRDLKPDNFGVYKRADRSWQLKLFDFSLAGVSEKDIKAGTRGYLDPFLGSPRRPHFDDHAERYAAAVTLHEMASAERPLWGDDIADPLTFTDETPKIADELFEPALRDGLTAFFRRALHRDVDHRFDTTKQMEDAWRSIFRAADATAPATTPDTEHGEADKSLDAKRDAAADAAKLTTPLVAAGLTPRAESVANTLGANTVGELLDIAPSKIAAARGAGASVRRELNRRHKQWTTALRRATGAAPIELTAGKLSVDDMVARLLPASGKRVTKKSQAIRFLLGIADSDGAAGSAWPTQSEVARRIDATQATVSQSHQAAVQEWAGADWLGEVRDEVVDTLIARGRVATVEELAAAIRVRHGVSEGPPDVTMAKCLAVVRAAVDTESSMASDMDDPDGVDPRFAVLRRGGSVLVAMESLLGTEDPSAPELADYAVELGRRADQLVAEADALPGGTAVVRELRAVPPPPGLQALADTRLVNLAARMSKEAAGSPRLELYPRVMDLTRVLRLSQAAAGVRPGTGISLESLLGKVRARFPEVDLGKRPPTHVQVEDALREAGFQLEYDVAEGQFRVPTIERGRSSSLFSQTSMPTGVIEPADELSRRLDHAIERGGFKALTLRGVNLPGVAAALVSRWRVSEVDFNRLFLDEFRALARENNADWRKVLTIDARFTETGRVAPGLRSYLDHTWQRVDGRLMELAGERTVLFLHDAGLIARYFDAGGRAFLVRLQKAARRAEDRPHGLWLLCPGETSTAAPRLDGHIVEVEDPSEQIVLDSKLLEQLKRPPTAA